MYKRQEFGFTVYAETEQGSKTAVDEAITTLLNSFQGDDGKLRKFLDAHGVKHRFGTTEVPDELPRWEGLSVMQREIEVSLAPAV